MSTFGQIRLRLSQEFPGVNPDLLNSVINGAYGDILDARDWSQLKTSSSVVTTAPYQAGTVTATNLSATLTGLSTAWTSAVNGLSIVIGGTGNRYTVTFVSGTSVTLDRVYEGDTTSGASYTMFVDEYALSTNVKSISRIKNQTTGVDLYGPLNRGAVLTMPFTTGEPAYFAQGLPTGSNPVYQTVVLWPIPSKRSTLNVEYQTLALGFDGRNTGDSPLPWINAEAIIQGAAMKLEKDAGEFQRRTMLYREALGDIHGQENYKVAPVRVTPHRKFTQHEGKRR